MILLHRGEKSREEDFVLNMRILFLSGDVRVADLQTCPIDISKDQSYVGSDNVCPEHAQATNAKYALLPRDDAKAATSVLRRPVLWVKSTCLSLMVKLKALIEHQLETKVCLILLMVISLVYFGTLYPDQGWGDDFAQYIHQAINISQGTDMIDTGYIYSRYTPSLGPRAYPAGFPLLLALTYKVFGLSMWAFQTQIILMQLTALAVIYRLYRREVAPLTALILLLMMGLSPYLISFKRAIMSDVPFMLVSLTFVLWVERSNQQRRFQHGAALVAALLAFACYLIRTIGFVTLAALVLSDLIRQRRLQRFTLWTMAFAIIFVIISRVLFGNASDSYLDQLIHYSPLTVLDGVDHYLVHSIRGFWAGPSLPLGGVKVPILWLMAAPLILLGFVQRARRSSLFMELFFLFHLGIILAWPSFQELRFLYPILPLFLLYAGIGLEAVLGHIAQRTNLRLARSLAAICAVGFTVVYGVRTQKVIAAEGPIVDGPYAPTATALFQFVSEETSPDTVFVFYKPRALSLYTQRKASTYPYGQPLSVAVAYLEEIKADYTIIKKYDSAHSDVEVMAFVERCKDAFKLVFDNELFEVLHINQEALHDCGTKLLIDE